MITATIVFGKKETEIQAATGTKELFKKATDVMTDRDFMPSPDRGFMRYNGQNYRMEKDGKWMKAEKRSINPAGVPLI